MRVLQKGMLVTKVSFVLIIIEGRNFYHVKIVAIRVKNCTDMALKQY